VNARVRSALFVPAHREGWVEKALAAGPDAVILDLEDSVPEGEKDSARERIGRAIDTLAGTDVTVVVRPGAEADLEACVRPGLDALLLPKVDSVEQLLGWGGHPVSLWVTLETARGYLNAANLAHAPRVTGLLAATGKGGDVQRELGYRPTVGGLETLYVRSHAILAARAAGLPHVLTGPWQELHDLDGLHAYAASNRDLGFTGEVVIHPSHVEVVNAAYSPSADEVAYHEGLVAAYEAASAGAIDYQGAHVDAAHYETSKAFLERARG
jgi:citrate lyase subunit beta/citryl-CoA lyase